MKSFTQYHNEEVEQTNEWVVPIQPQRIIKRTPEEEKKHAERQAEKALHKPGKNAAKSRKYWVNKVNKLHGIGEEVELDEAKGLESALRKLVPGYGSRQALERNSAHWEVVNTLSRTKNEPEDKVRAKSLRHFKAAQKYSNILFKQRSLPEEVEQTLEEGNAENKQLRRAVDRKVGQTWLKRDSFSDVERKTTSPLKMGRGVNRFAKSETYKTLAKGKQVEEEMITFKEHTSEQIDEAIEGMTKKQHAEKSRQLKAEIEKHQKAYFEQLSKAHAIRDKLDAAKEAHKKHRELDPKVKAKNAEREADGWKHYIEPGRGREPTPSGGMGAR